MKINRTIVFIIVMCMECSALQPHTLKQFVDTLPNNQNIVSVQCVKSLKLYLDRLNRTLDEDNWALSMLDATSNMPIGVLSHATGDLGNFDQCIEIESAKDHIKGKYCLGSINLNNKYFHRNFTDPEDQVYSENIEKFLSNWIYASRYPNWAICLPSNCTTEDATYVMSMVETIGSGTSEVVCQTFEDANPPLYTDAFIGIAVLTFLLIIIILSTAYDLYCENKKIENKYAGCTAFSLYTNGKSIFRPQKRASNLSCLDGIRVISMIWIMFLHVYNMYFQSSQINYKVFLESTDTVWSTFFVNGHLACDTFFLIGGLLVTYLFFKKETPDKITCTNVIKHYIHRYVRLTPAIVGVAFITGTLLRYLGSGPKWIETSQTAQTYCKTYWWSTVLYIQSYVNPLQPCLVHTWYVEIDMQLFLLSPLIFWMLLKSRKIGISALVICALLSIVSSFVRIWHYGIIDIHSTKKTNFMSAVLNHQLHYYQEVDTRSVPWFIGTILGYILAKQETKRYYIIKVMVIPMWILSITMMFLCISGGHFFLQSPKYNVLQVLFFGSVRGTFSLAIAWVIWACANNYGGIINRFLSLPIFHLLNKFTYSMYILHYNLVAYLVNTQKTPIYFSMANVMYLSVGLFFWVFIFSVVWVLVFETPMINLENVVMKKLIISDSPSALTNLKELYTSHPIQEQIKMELYNLQNQHHTPI